MVEFWREPSSGLLMTDFLLYPHMAEKARELSEVSTYVNGTNPIHEGCTLMI